MLGEEVVIALLDEINRQNGGLCGRQSPAAKSHTKLVQEQTPNVHEA